jgi:hypothetical protein
MRCCGSWQPEPVLTASAFALVCMPCNQAVLVRCIALLFRAAWLQESPAALHDRLRRTVLPAAWQHSPRSPVSMGCTLPGHLYPTGLYMLCDPETGQPWTQPVHGRHSLAVTPGLGWSADAACSTPRQRHSSTPAAASADKETPHMLHEQAHDAEEPATAHDTSAAAQAQTIGVP